MRCSLYYVFLLWFSVVGGAPRCSEHDFSCENNECINAVLWCDSHVDCSDGSDEKYCKKAGLVHADPNKCTAAYFKCNDGPCIPMSGRCDGFKNCEDASDEESCEDKVAAFGNWNASFLSHSSTFMMTPKTMAAAMSSHSITSARSAINHPFEEANATLLSDDPDGFHSDFSEQIEKARDWLISQRGEDYGWGDETPRGVIALYLSEEPSIRKKELDMLMVKQLEVQLSIEMARNATKVMKLTDLALYINALMASCRDPKNFYGNNLVHILRNGVNAAHKGSVFVNPSVYLTLCLNNASTDEDVIKLRDMSVNGNGKIGRMDVQALAMLSITCISRKINRHTAIIHDVTKRFTHRIGNGGLPGNIYEAALLVQAVEEIKWSRPALLKFVLNQQQEDGSFGGILATYLALPVLAGRSFLDMNDHCDHPSSTDLAPIEVLKNTKRKKINVQYSLKYGDPPEVTQTIEMQVAEGINFLDVMRLAQEINPNYRFMLDGDRDIPTVYSIGGIPNDAEKGRFWTLHIPSSDRRLKGKQEYLAPFPGNIKHLIPHHGDEIVFWMRSI